MDGKTPNQNVTDLIITKKPLRFNTSSVNLTLPLSNGTGSKRPNTRKAYTKKAHFIKVPERPIYFISYQKGPQKGIFIWNKYKWFV